MFKLTLPSSSSIQDVKSKLFEKAGGQLSSLLSNHHLLCIETGNGKLAQVYFDNYEANKFRSGARLILHEVREPDNERACSSNPNEEVFIRVQCVHGIKQSATPALLSVTHCLVLPLPKSKLENFPVELLSSIVQERMLPFVKPEHYVSSSEDALPTCSLPANVRFCILSDDCLTVKQFINPEDTHVRLPNGGFSICVVWRLSMDDL